MKLRRGNGVAGSRSDFCLMRSPYLVLNLYECLPKQIQPDLTPLKLAIASREKHKPIPIPKRFNIFKSKI